MVKILFRLICRCVQVPIHKGFHGRFIVLGLAGIAVACLFGKIAGHPAVGKALFEFQGKEEGEAAIVLTDDDPAYRGKGFFMVMGDKEGGMFSLDRVAVGSLT